MAYLLIMAFTLVYTAEHYVIDILLGWVLAAVVIGAINRLRVATTTGGGAEIRRVPCLDT